jgi:hypothetical protein
VPLRGSGAPRTNSFGNWRQATNSPSPRVQLSSGHFWNLLEKEITTLDEQTEGSM